jgi:hypothetical protein
LSFLFMVSSCCLSNLARNLLGQQVRGNPSVA